MANLPDTQEWRPGSLDWNDAPTRSQTKTHELAIQSDGNLVLYGLRENPVWSTSTQGRGATQLVLQGDGNLVIYRGNEALWSSGTSGR